MAVIPDHSACIFCGDDTRIDNTAKSANAFTSDERGQHAPGLHFDDDRTAVLVESERSQLVICNFGSEVQIGGVVVRDPDVLRRLGAHLDHLANQLAAFHWTKPATSGVENKDNR